MIVPLCAAALGLANVIELGVTKTAALPPGELTTTFTASELDPSTTVKTHDPAAMGVMVNVCCGAGPPAPLICAIPLQAVVSGRMVPLDAVAVKVPGEPPMVSVIVPPLPLSPAPDPPPTVIPIDAD